jgi:hypothetical protein
LAVATLTCGENTACGSCTPTSGASSGTISDGAGNYANNANCWWLLATSPGVEIRISFLPSFDTESGYDDVTIYQCSSASCSPQTLIQKLSGSPSASAVYTSTVYTSTTGFLKVTFTSDGSVVGSGFTGTWSCGAVAATTECTTCTAGTYSATEGAPDCTNCAKFSSAVGASTWKQPLVAAAALRQTSLVNVPWYLIYCSTISDFFLDSNSKLCTSVLFASSTGTGTKCGIPGFMSQRKNPKDDPHLLVRCHSPG